jgi:hypothetical protein
MESQIWPEVWGPISSDFHELLWGEPPGMASPGVRETPTLL